MLESHRRGFLARIGAACLAADASKRLVRAAEIGAGRHPDELAEVEDYWAEIRRAFDSDRTLINFNHGGVAPAPIGVLEAMFRDLRFSNVAPAHQMWQVLEPRIESVRRELAREFGCDPEEMAITRNASESLGILINGLDLKRGDEVIVSNQNYPRMLNMWAQRARRDGVVVKTVSFGGPAPSPEKVIASFREAITPRTKVVEITHVVNLTGNILPVHAVVAMARERGIQTFVDGAHAFAHFPFRRDDLGCDFYATSLHKWLLAPIGTGFLYVRKEMIPKVWPLLAAPESLTGDIRKFEEIGTHPAAIHNAIAGSLAFHRSIGADRKIARLRYLRSRWATQIADANPRARLLSPQETERASGIGLLHVEGLKPGKLTEWLWEKRRIVTVAITHDEFDGIRATPNVDASIEDVDVFAESVLKAIKAIG
ncbi:aminotransferase class V-fold PLP-dependent enzyme [Aquisphaera insulae]|uniref:aminotransferase class V-fold PLP-dependent enzyme n=1 Tax=Aquisphaera insulae TaxID=2712864 RepID=UPI0013EB2AAB|nr:aminotransferase class V-fold PLP-dependent enzyme [Aquisphaera insulae]